LFSVLDTAIGLNLDDIDQTKDLEKVEFRLELLKIVKNRILRENQENSNLRFNSIYAPNLEIDSNRLLLKKSFRPKLNLLQQVIEIKVFNITPKLDTFNLIVKLEETPDQILEFIKLKAKEAQIDLIPDDICLNVCGSDEIIYGKEHCISSYKYIQKCIAYDKMPTFFINSIDKLKSKLNKPNSNVLMSVERVLNELENKIEITNSLRSESFVKDRIYSWDLNQTFSILFDFVQYYPPSKDYEKVNISFL
jgi:hypothetical protein